MAVKTINVCGTCERPLGTRVKLLFSVTHFPKDGGDSVTEDFDKAVCARKWIQSLVKDSEEEETNAGN